MRVESALVKDINQVMRLENENSFGASAMSRPRRNPEVPGCEEKYLVAVMADAGPYFLQLLSQMKSLKKPMWRSIPSFSVIRQVLRRINSQRF